MVVLQHLLKTLLNPQILLNRLPPFNDLFLMFLMLGEPYYLHFVDTFPSLKVSFFVFLTHDFFGTAYFLVFYNNREKDSGSWSRL